MEDLTKTQLILLALLVSFVTSIATGIVTITLLDQAPPGVTQTINRVVERTVEKVVPGQAASVITKETTVVVKEENLIVDAVDKNSKNLARIATLGEEGALGKILGVGVILSSDGLIATDSLNLVADVKNYLIKAPSGKIWQATLDNVNPGTGLAFLKIVTAEEEEAPKLGKPSFGDTSSLKLGQTVIGIGGLSENSVSTGILAKLNKETSVKESTATSTPNQEISILKSINTSLSMSPDFSGGPLIDVDGFLLGINLKRKDGDLAVPIDLILDITAKKLENTENKQP